METKILGWEISEVVALLKCVNDSQSLNEAFKCYANKSNRKYASVRNYFYRLQDVLKENIDMSNYIKSFGVGLKFGDKRRFDNNAEYDLLSKVLSYDNKLSVRAICLKLANNDKQLFIRLQNKYRSLLKNTQLVNKVKNDLKEKNICVREINNKDNIVIMQPRCKKVVSDDEIKSLFFGLVKLVKKSAQDEIMQRINERAILMNNSLKRTMIDNRKKELIITELQENNNKIGQELVETKAKLAQEVSKNLSNTLTLNSLVKSQKMEELKNFIAKLNTNVVSTTNQ